MIKQWRRKKESQVFVCLHVDKNADFNKANTKVKRNFQFVSFFFHFWHDGQFVPFSLHFLQIPMNCVNCFATPYDLALIKNVWFVHVFIRIISFFGTKIVIFCAFSFHRKKTKFFGLCGYDPVWIRFDKENSVEIMRNCSILMQTK